MTNKIIKFQAWSGRRINEKDHYAAATFGEAMKRKYLECRVSGKAQKIQITERFLTQDMGSTRSWVVTIKESKPQ